jgi:hypothetical protein
MYGCCVCKAKSRVVEQAKGWYEKATGWKVENDGSRVRFWHDFVVRMSFKDFVYLRPFRINRQ